MAPTGRNGEHPMPEVKTNAILPKGEGNGLNEVATDLIKDPSRYRAVIGIVDCRRVTIDSDTGDQAATVRFRRVEVLLSGDLAEAERLLRRALESRSGQEQLPLELEDEISQAFAGLDLDKVAEEEKQAKERGDDAPPEDPPEEAGPSE
jgi:hypothetical protein